VAGPDAFVGRRRELQRALRALDAGKPVLVCGLGHQGKTSLAARVARRLGGEVAVVFGADDLDAGAVYAAVAHAGGVGEARDVAEAITRLRDDPGQLSTVLAALWRRLHPRPLLVLDNLEDALHLHEDPPRVKDPAHAIVLRGALRAAADAAAPLVLTCREVFVLPDHRGRDLLAAAEVIALDGLSPEERRLLPRVRSAGVDAGARDACLDASGGNPGLLDQLLRLAAEVDDAALDDALVALRDARATGQGALDAWLQDVVGQLVDLLTPAQRALLTVSGVLAGPAPEAAVRAAWSEMVGATSADADRLLRLGLWVRVPDPERPAEAFAVVPQALATRRAGDVGDLAAGAAAALLAAWAPEPSAHTAATVTRLALVAGDRAAIVAHAVLALQVGLGRHDIPPTQALAREVAAALPDEVPEQLALVLSNVLALDDPGAALAVLERSGGPLAHGRRGQLLIGRGELAGAEAAFRESLAGLAAGTREYAVMLGGIADILQARGQLDEALSIRTDEQLPVFAQLGDTREAAVTLGKIAEIYQQWGHVDVALHIFRDVQLPIFDRVGDKREVAFALGRVADIVAARGDLREALRIQTDEVLPTFVALGDLQSQAVTHGQIADIHQTQGELAEALRIRTECELPAFESLGATRERAVTLGKIADILGTFGQLDEALRFRLEEELPIFERIGDAREIAVTLGGVADLMRARGQLDEAMRIHIDRRLPIYRQMGDVREQAVTWGRIADILQIQGRLDEAHRIRTDEELPILQQIGEVREIAIATGKMADIAMARGQLDDALKTFTDHVLPAFERVGDVRSQAVTRGRIADVHWLRGELREALVVLTDYVMPVYEQLGDTREKILAIARIADIEGHLGKVDDAIRVYVAKVIPAFTQHRAPLDLLVHQARLAVLLSWRGDPTDVLAARDLFIEALRAARQHGFPVEERQIVALMTQLGCPTEVIDAIR
jgi:tetratricopeptide (TPR) repeat protein